MTFLNFSRFVGCSGPDLKLRSGNVEGCKVSCSVLNLPSDSLYRIYLLEQWGRYDDFIRSI